MVAQMLGGITLSTQILKANFVQLGKELEESSRMSGAGFWRTYLRIVFPLMAQTMVMVASSSSCSRRSIIRQSFWRRLRN